ncbi:sulfite exporter TauE/SafE family protein [Fodinicurvata fenggangensis]|uniref:sulfite exporter TauE/SafE family protein n=1 Tax=Fodinicurvata fenggangensis TaxID=1121830 RepID=UPI00047DF313|nr:sulfite exporter TauE/SafE family protein [Fodinicurvata fenggangensis]
MDILNDPLLLIFWALAMLGVGAFAGLIAGLLGVGGGIVIVPALYHVLALMDVSEAIRMHVAVGSSLAIIIPTSLISARSHYRREAVDLPLLKRWVVPLLVGVIVGAVVAAYLNGNVLAAVFAVVALLVSIRMLRGEDTLNLAESLPGEPIRSLLASFIGMVSTMMGIGGGTLTVPLLSACNYPIRRAVGTASAVGIVIAIPGAIGFLVSGQGVEGRPPLTIGYINLVAFCLIVPTTTLLAPYGARLAHTIKPGRLKIAFALFLLATSLRLFYDLFTAFQAG